MFPKAGYYQGPYQGPPVMAPPQYQYGPPPPRRSPGFLEGWYVRELACSFSASFN
jgi:hypothetical protein